MKKFKFTISGDPYEVHIKDIEDNIATVEVNGTAYEVELDREIKNTKTPKLVSRPVKTEPGEAKIQKQEANTFKLIAPLPGVIMSIHVKEGDTVKKGDLILMMEAMKMENRILAEKDGVVTKIHAKAQQNVLQDALLVEFSS